MTSLKYFISIADSLILINRYAILAVRESEEMEMALCKNCGTSLTEGSKFCMKCGQRQESLTGTQVSSVSAIQEIKDHSPADGTVAEKRWYQRNAQLPAAEDISGEDSTSIIEVYKQVFSILRRKPLKLWGASMLGSLFLGIVPILAVLPIVSIPITLVLTFGLTGVYIIGSRCEEPEVEQLFCGFKNFRNVAKVMGWKLLWVFLWVLIPVAGIVLAIMKEYSYKFVPHILYESSELSPDDALKKSMAITQGSRLKMFVADLIIVAIVTLGSLLFAVGTRLWPFEVFFIVLLVLWGVLAAVFVPLIMGLVSAVFYERLAKNEE